MNILIVVDGGNGQNEVISIPYSESFIDDMAGGLSTLIINEISVKGEPNTRFTTEKNSWDFKFNLKISIFCGSDLMQKISKSIFDSLLTLTQLIVSFFP